MVQCPKKEGVGMALLPFLCHLDPSQTFYLRFSFRVSMARLADQPFRIAPRGPVFRGARAQKAGAAWQSWSMAREGRHGCSWNSWIAQASAPLPAFSMTIL